GAAVIEDAAQAMGALDDGQSVGLKGDVGFFSMALGKGLTTAEGGVLFSRDPVLHQALHRQSRQDLPFSLRWELQRSAELWGYALLYR
ncbi:DegT/DnrJ/EryC1/StrS family aminotransferase, partial [Pseudomonas sp. SIMBA_065]